LQNTTVIDIDNATQDTHIKLVSDKLPIDSINLYDTNQIKFWSDNAIVRQAIKYVISRKLHVACNKPRALYFSLTDISHKNRLCIPFMYNNVVEHYQTRGILAKDLQSKPKYLSKLNSDKTLFNIDNIRVDSPNIYIVEGPIDSFFIRNSVAVAGIQNNTKTQFSIKQKQQIREYMLHNKIWCLDSQQQDETSRDKTRLLLESGESVFIWPDLLGKKYKDFNDYCVGEQVNEFPEDIILDNTYSGERGNLRLSTIELQTRRSGGFSVLSGFAFST